MTQTIFSKLSLSDRKRSTTSCYLVRHFRVNIKSTREGKAKTPSADNATDGKHSYKTIVRMKKYSLRYLISWHPRRHKKFILARSNLLVRNTERVLNEIKLKDVATCFDWCEGDNLILGLNNGEVYIVNSETLQTEQEFLIPGRFKVRCHDVSANKYNNLHFAASYSGCPDGLFIWDRRDFALTSEPSSYDLGSTSSGGRYISIETPKKVPYGQPKWKYLKGEASRCCCWRDNHTIIVGTGNQLRGIDLRVKQASTTSGNKRKGPPNNYRFALTAHAFPVNHVKINPFNNNFYASASDQKIRIWDIRKHPNPVIRFMDAKSKSPILQIDWSPIEEHILGTTNHGRLLKLWNARGSKCRKPLSQAFRISEYKSVYPFLEKEGANERIQGFSFHPKIHRKILCCGENLIDTVHVPEYRNISFGPMNQLVITERDKLRLSVDAVPKEYDFLRVIRERARRGYSMDIYKNYEIAESLGRGKEMFMWKWIQRNRDLGCTHLEFGVEGILRIRDEKRVPFRNLPPKLLSLHGKTPSSSNSSSSSGGGGGGSFFLREFKSLKRSICLLLCGWFEILDQIKETCDWEEQVRRSKVISGLPPHPDLVSQRGVALALFNGDLKSAETILRLIERTSGEEESVDKVIYYALRELKLVRRKRGGGGGGSKLASVIKENEMKGWIDTLSDPYLRAAFRLLYTSDPKLTLRLCPQLLVHHQVIIGCKYMNDNDLLPFIHGQYRRLRVRGDIMGLLITGLSVVDGIKILRNYVDRTMDVQFPCLLYLQNWKPNSSERKQIYILRLLFEYRNLLDRWKLWEIRALLDSSLSHLEVHSVKFRLYPKKPKILIECSHCSASRVKKRKPSSATTTTSSSSSSSSSSSRMMMNSKLVSPANKHVFCETCHNPLTRCAVCLMPFGIPLRDLHTKKRAVKSSKEKQINDDFNFAYSWCQKCRHGGHVIHLKEWFLDHKCCPTADCSCECSIVDFRESMEASRNDDGRRRTRD